MSASAESQFHKPILKQAGELQLVRARESGEAALLRHRLLGARYGGGQPIRDIAKEWDMDAAFLHNEFRKAREEFRSALMEVVKDVQGGGSEKVEQECRRLLQHFP